MAPSETLCMGDMQTMAIVVETACETHLRHGVDRVYIDRSSVDKMTGKVYCSRVEQA